MSGSRKPFDIRVYKRALRERYKAVRAKLEPETQLEWDGRIRERLTGMPQYQVCKTLLCYVSLRQEIDTRELIRTALREGKRVAVPFCIPGTRNMDFYLIESLDALVPGTFGVMEPDPARAEKLADFTGSLCILPGLSFDHAGYRLGYGGGYYDRFLSGVYRGVTVGLCYQACMRPRLIHGRYDVACDYIVTEQGVRKAAKKSRKKPEAP